MATLPTTVRNDALGLSTDLAQAGAVFNDATRLLDGGLWNNPADSNNQIAYLGMYTTDVTAVLNDINAALANPNGVTVGGNAYTLSDQDKAVLSQVQGQLQTLITEANHSVGTSHAAATAQELLHTTQTTILNEINGDGALATALGRRVLSNRDRREQCRLPGAADRLRQCRRARGRVRSLMRRWPTSVRCSTRRPILPSAASTRPILASSTPT